MSEKTFQENQKVVRWFEIIIERKSSIESITIEL